MKDGNEALDYGGGEVMYEGEKRRICGCCCSF
jgi:hypothetical protein